MTLKYIDENFKIVKAKKQTRHTRISSKGKPFIAGSEPIVAIHQKSMEVKDDWLVDSNVKTAFQKDCFEFRMWGLSVNKYMQDKKLKDIGSRPNTAGRLEGFKD